VFALNATEITDVEGAASTRPETRPAWLTASEVAAALRLPPSTVYDLARRGEIPSVRFGRHGRVPRAWLDNLAGDAVVCRAGGQGAARVAPNLRAIPLGARPAVRGR
jgi:excisionase family DNA binding protein